MKKVLPNIDPSQTAAWAKLQAHYQEAKSFDLQTLFAQNAQRARDLTREIDSLRFDYSKNLVTADTLDLLRELADECQVSSGIEAMFNGEAINETEGRAVLHVALRNHAEKAYFTNGENVSEKVQSELQRLKAFSNDVLDGRLQGETGKAFKQVVHIGIGGSDLGPRMVVDALQPWKTHLKVHFVANVDESDLKLKLEDLNAEETLFIVASKSFTTQETMTNALTAKKWLIAELGNDEAVSRHFVALSTNLDGVKSFGILPERTFEFWDWVGGRFSVWSAIGLPVMLAIGPDHFDDFLKGAEIIDEHVEAEGVRSIPATMALLGIWYTNFFNRFSQAILPYSELLKSFPAFLQQCEMESNGKGRSRAGEHMNYDTVGIIWGAAGTNGQHAFYQQLHQSTRWTPCDFIAYARPIWGEEDHHQKLLANMLAQSQALMEGKKESEVRKTLKEEGLSEAQIEQQLPFRVFEGNRPSSLLFLDQWDPRRLGMLIALYEHKVLVQGLIWNIHSFDQWGVELGKALAKPVLRALQDDLGINKKFDASTLETIKWIKRQK